MKEGGGGDLCEVKGRWGWMGEWDISCFDNGFGLCVWEIRFILNKLICFNIIKVNKYVLMFFFLELCVLFVLDLLFFLIFYYLKNLNIILWFKIR